MQELMSKLGVDTLTEMSRKTNIPTETLRKWAIAQRSPVATLETACNLERATGIPVEELLAGFQEAET